MKDETVPALTSPQSTDRPYCQRGSLSTGAPLPAEDPEVTHRPKHQLLGEGRQGGLTGHTVQAAVHSGLETVGEQMQQGLHTSPPWLATREIVHQMAEAPVSGQNQHVNGERGRLEHRWTLHGCHPPFLGGRGERKKVTASCKVPAWDGNANTSPSPSSPSPLGAAAGPYSLPIHNTLVVPRSVGWGRPGGMDAIVPAALYSGLSLGHVGDICQL